MRVRNESGFTLIEILVAVAIVSILAVIAVPQYQRFSARARQSDARAALTSVFTAEKAFAIANTSFSACLGAVGYKPESGGSRFYTIGFFSPAQDDDSPTQTKCGPSGTSACNAVSWKSDGSATQTCEEQDGGTYFVANASVEGSASEKPNVSADEHKSRVKKSLFRAAAYGKVFGKYFDVWTIDDTKELVNAASGIVDESEAGAGVVEGSGANYGSGGRNESGGGPAR